MIGDDIVYELIQITENCYYIQSPAKVGLVILNDEDVCIIDSGNDKEAGRKIRKLIDVNGWKLKAIAKEWPERLSISAEEKDKGIMEF